MSETVSAHLLDGALNRIRYRPSGLNLVEARIAAAILEDPRRVARESIVSFARRTSVSTGSVVRFAKIIGYSGYHDLKMAIAEELAQGPREVLPSRVNSRFRSYMDEQVRAMVFASEELDSLSMERAASYLSRANRIDIAATGASAVAGQALMFSLTLLGLHVRFLPDSAEQGAAAAFMGPGDCLVAISFSGYTRATVDAAARATASGANVISLTCNQAGRLLRYTTVPIVLDAGKGNFEAEWPLRTAMLAVARGLSLYVSDQYTENERNARRTTWASGRFGLRYS